MTTAEREVQLLESIASNLRAEGYDVFIRPQPGVLPPFMADYTPDAIGFGKPTSDSRELSVASRQAIEGSLAGAQSLNSTGSPAPALIMAWATFEALARRRSPLIFARPQTPQRLIEMFAAEGHVTPDEADLLRRLAETRNKLVHGELEVAISVTEVSDFIAILAGLMKSEAQEAAE